MVIIFSLFKKLCHFVISFDQRLPFRGDQLPISPIYIYGQESGVWDGGGL